MTTPLISDQHELKNVLQFTLSNVNYSMANAIRRTIMADIPCFVFKTTPYSESKCDITKNTSKFNNEIIKQRLSCIPIHLKDTSLDVTNCTLVLNVKNDTNDIMYVTTEHFQIYDEALKKLCLNSKRNAKSNTERNTKRKPKREAKRNTTRILSRHSFCFTVAIVWPRVW